MSKAKQSNFRTVMSNNLFMLKLLNKATKTRLLFDSLFHISRGVVQTLIYTVLFGSVVNAIQVKADFSDILIFVGIISGVTLGASLYQSWFTNIYIPQNDLKIQKYIISNIYEHASQLDISEYDDPSFYDNYIRTLEEAQQRCIRVSSTAAQFIGTLLTSGLLLGIILSIDLFILLFIALPIIPSLWFGKKRNKVQFDLYMENTKPLREAKYVNRVMYMRKYAKDIRTTNIFSLLLNKYSVSMKKVISNTKKFGIKDALYSFIISGGINDIQYVLILIYITYRIVVSKTLLIGDYLIIQNAAQSMSWRIQWLVQSYLKFEKNSPYISQFKIFSDRKPTIENENNMDKPDRSDAEIRFSNVSFSYDGENHVLKDINITINKGEKVAVVGKNGAGKSTFIKLLLHLYQPQQGIIHYNSKDIKTYDTKEYRRCFSTVFQNFMLYAFSISDNITMDNTFEDEADGIRNAIAKTGLLEKVQGLADGIQTPLTKEFDETGFIPSGGEQQKLAIARALYKNSDIFILDEPSSSLDPKAEAEINKLMMEITEDKTVILISHRLSTTVYADKIYLFDEGRIVEEGSHKELLRKGGIYSEMFLKQAELYNSGKGMEC